MLLELAKPVVLVVCILSLYAVFYAAFLDPAINLDQRIWESLGLLALAGCLALASGLIFRETLSASSARNLRITATLPVRMFCWATGLMLVLFLVAWYLETHCILYRDIRTWV